MECGYDHLTLNAMTEEEFGFELEARLELDRLRDEARKEASKG